MRLKIFPFLFSFLFLIIILSSQAYAVLPVDINVTTTLGSNSRQIRCTNSTIDQKIYCFLFYDYSYNQRFFRYNSTLNGIVNCSAAPEYSYTNCPNGNMAVLNESFLLFACGTSSCDLWNVSDIANGNCERIKSNSSGCNDLTTSAGGGFGVFGNNVYLPQPKKIIDKTNYSTVSSGYWSNSYDYGFGIKWATSISIPRTDSTIYVSYGFNSSSPFLRYDGGTLTSIIYSVQTLYGINSSAFFEDIIYNNANNLDWIFMFDRTNGRIFRANFTSAENYSETCDWTDEPIGTKCVNETNHRLYVTNLDNCALTYGSCPSGTICSQLTPQFNVTSDLVENYTSCQIVTNLGFRINCWNVCFWGSVVWSNCVEQGCKQCPDASGGIRVGGVYGFFTNTWYSNQSSVSVPSYTIACINTTTGYSTTIIDNEGNETNETELLTKAGNKITSIIPEGCYNTSTTCYDSDCNIIVCAAPDIRSNPAGYVASAFGSLFGITDISVALAFFSVIASMVVGIVVLYYARNEEGMAGKAFIAAVTLTLLGFTIIGWFPVILIILMGAIVLLSVTGILSKIFSGGGG